MKKLLLSTLLSLFSLGFMAQVVVSGVSPQSIVGGYEFAIQTHPGWPGGQDNGTWGLALDFNVPGTFIQAEIQLTDDDALGMNAQGNPYSASGCGAQLNDLTGKIAVVFRYDGVDDNPATTAADGPDNCTFATKALNCQLAGAIAVIVVNRDDQLNLSMTGGDTQLPPPYVGTDVTIPVVMLKNIDGEAIVAALQNGPVEMFIGNKTGAFLNDISISSNSTLGPKAGMVHSLLAQNGSEFNFDIGTRIYNPGALDQNNVSLNVKVINPSGTEVYNNDILNLSIVSGDSIDISPVDVNSLPNFSLSNYPIGTYKVIYTAYLGGVDDYSNDNVVEFSFTVNDSIYSYAAADSATNLIGATAFATPNPFEGTFSACTVIKDPNAGRVAVTGLYFAAQTNANTDPLNGQEMILQLWEWNDVFSDLNDPSFPAPGADWNLVDIATRSYYFPNTGDFEGKFVFGSFQTPIVLSNNQRYMACVQTSSPDIRIGYGDQNYTWNTDFYLQPLFPVESGLVYYATGFGSDFPSAVGIGLIDKNNIGLSETNFISGMAYPNPANDKVTVSIEGEGVASLNATDITGKTVMTNSINLVGGKSDVTIASLESGIYIFNVTLENGKTAQFNVVKK
jgi:hypothetical protein